MEVLTQSLVPKIVLFILLLSFATVTNSYVDGCKNYTVLSEADRAQVNSGLTTLCDSNLLKGWYRFQVAAGDRMLDECLSQYGCGTKRMGWLSGAHPTVPEGVVTRKVCYSSSDGCCQISNNIAVKNCRSYFVYELQKPPICDARYCGNAGAGPKRFPANLGGTPGNVDGVLNVSWTALDLRDWGRDCAYVLFYRPNVTSASWNKKTVSDGCDRSNWTLSRLLPNTVYEIAIRAENSEGPGLMSPSIFALSGQSPPQSVTLNASHLLVNVSSKFVINCTVIGGPDDLNIRWFKAGKVIGLSHRTKVETGVRHSRLTVRDVMTEDEGDYVCQAIKGNQNGTASVFIGVVPVLEITPRTVTKRVGDKATFTCGVVSGFRKGASVLIIEMTNRDNEVRHQEMNFTATNLQIPEGGESHVRKFVCEMSVQQKVLSRSEVAELIIIKPDAPKCREELLDGVLWSVTAAGKMNIKPCPNGASGTASRDCSEDVTWKDTNFVGCSSAAFLRLGGEIEAIMEDFHSNTTAQQVLSQLVNVTQPVSENDTTRPPEIFGGDLVIAVEILVKLADYNAKQGNVSAEEDTKNFTQVASNLLETTNRITWLELEKLNQGQGQRLVKAMDDYGLGAAATFTGPTDPRVVPTKNLVMRIDRANNNSMLRVKGLNVTYNQSSIQLPPEAFRSSRDSRVITLVYLTLNDVLPLGKESKDDDDDDEVLISANTTIVSSTIDPRPPAVLNKPVKVILQNRVNVPTGVLPQAKCVFWRPGESAIWQTSGCRLVPSESDIDITTCECDHLTIFASLMDPFGAPVGEAHTKALEIISIVGCSISLLAVTITIAATLFFWRAVKSPRAKVLLNLCAALAVSCVLFISEEFARDNKVGCTILAALLHYFLLALFCWMLCEGVLHYFLIVKVFGGGVAVQVKYFYIFGWGFPMIIVAISLGATQTDGYGSPEACWLDVPSGLIWAFIAPAIVIILVNIVVFILVIRQMMGTRQIQNKTQIEKVKAGVKASAVILPLLGITWLFGLLSFNPSTIIFQYIFAIANSLQGLMIFIFHCLLNKQIKDAIRRRQEKSSAAVASTTPKTKPSPIQNVKHAINVSAAGNKKQPTWPQNDYEMVDRTASEKNAIINIPEDQNIDEQLPATKGLAQVEPEEEKNLLPFENEIWGRDEACLRRVERRSSSSFSSSDSEMESVDFLSKEFNPVIKQEDVSFVNKDDPLERALPSNSDDPTPVRTAAKKVLPMKCHGSLITDEDLEIIMEQRRTKVDTIVRARDAFKSPKKSVHTESSHSLWQQVREKILRGSYRGTRSGGSQE